MKNYKILFLILLLTISQVLQSAALGRSARYGDIIITEVQLDNDGVVAALPYHGNANGANSGVEDITNNKTVKTDIVIEIYNKSITDFDMNNLSFLYLVEPREAAFPVRDGGGLDLGYDICGLQDNTGNAGVITLLSNLTWPTSLGGNINLTTKTFDGLASSILAASEVVAVYDQAKMAHRTINNSTVDYLQRAGDTYSTLFGEKHSWPVTAAADYGSTDFPVDITHHRLFSGGLDLFFGGTAELAGMAGGVDSTEVNSYFGRAGYPGISSDILVPRLCLGNMWTPEAVYTTPLGGVVTGIGSWNFTIILLDKSNNGILDIFSLARGASAQAHINSDGLVSVGDFNFTELGDVLPVAGTAPYCVGAGVPKRCELENISYIKTLLSPASSRSSYVLTSIPTIGTVDDVTPPDPIDNGTGDFLSSTNLELQIIRPPIVGNTLEPGFDGKIGDPDSIFSIKFQATHNGGGTIASVKAKIVTTGASPSLFPTSTFINLVFNGGTNKFEGQFSPLTVRPGLVDSQEYQIRVFATDNLGVTDNEFVGGSVAFTAVRSAPIINVFQATFISPLKIGDIIPISVDVADEGTAVLKHIKISLVSTIDGSFVPVQESFILPTFNDTPYKDKPPLLKPKYLHNFTVPSSVKTDGTTYHFQLDIADGFYTSDARQRVTAVFSTPFFSVETAPLLDVSLIGGHPVNLVVDTSTTIDIRNAIRYNGTLGDTTIDIVLASKDTNISACTVTPVEGASQLTITAGSVAGTGNCTFTLTTDDSKVGKGTITVNILPSADTFLNSFRIAPSLTPSVTPTGFTSKSKASWSDILEFETNLSDIDGVKSVQMNFVLTESGFLSGGIPVPPGTVIYSVYLYDDFTDRRQPPNLPAGGTIPFGTSVLGGDNFYSYDTNLLDGSATAVFETRGQSFVGPSNGTMDRFPASTIGERQLISYEADLSNSGDGLWHISIAPIKFQFPTHYQIDLVVEDNNLIVTNLTDVGGISVFTGPGYEVLTALNNTAFLGTESATAQNKVINLSSFECTAPEGVAGRKCGGALTNQEHTDLTWTVVSFDTSFYSNVVITDPVQDQITYSILPHACADSGSGFVNLAVSDGVVNTTTSEYSLPITCVNDKPIYSSNYATLGPRPILSVAEESSPATLSIASFANEIIVGMGEDAQNALVWTVQTGSGNHPNLTAFSVSGNNLLVTPVANFSHPFGQSDTIVLCVEDSSGLVPDNGDVAKNGGVGTCISVPIAVVASDDNPVISINGTVSAPPIVNVSMNEDDAPQTFTIGYFDVDGPFPTNPWVIDAGQDLSAPAVGTSPILTIELSAGAMVGTSGQLWNMKVTLKPDHYGHYLYKFSVDNGGALSSTQNVEFNITQKNDAPFFSNNLCLGTLMTLDSTDSVASGGVATKTSILGSPIAWNDVDLSIHPSQNENLRIFLKSVDYEGVNFSIAQSQKVTVSGVEVLSNFLTQGTEFAIPATSPLFKVRMINNSTGEIEISAVDKAAVENATLHFIIRDRDNTGPDVLESVEDSTCIIKVRDNGTPNIGATPSQIAAAIGPITEDSTVFIDLGIFEVNNYNFFGGPLDSDLTWSVKVTAGSSMFDNNVDYPDFKEYLLEQNLVSKVNCLTNLSGVNRTGSAACNPQAIIGQTIDISSANSANDTLFIHPAPDMHGDFTLELILDNKSCTGQIACTITTSVNLTILPVVDPPEITIRKAGDPKLNDTAYIIQLPDTGSVLKIDTTTWENYSRDFIKPVTGNPVTQFWNDNPLLQSKNSSIYHLGHASCNTYFEDYLNNDNLCIFADGNASATGGSSSIDMVLHNGPTEVTRTITIDVGRVNHPPQIILLEDGIVVQEDIVLTKDLTNHGDDREEELAGNEAQMNWFFGSFMPIPSERTFPLNELSSKVGNTSVVTQTPLFSSLTIDQNTNILSMSPIENLTGIERLVFVLCDLDSGLVGEKLCITTDIGLEISPIDDTPILSDIVTQSTFQTLFETNEGLCMSVDLSTIVSDIENDAMQYSLISTSIIDFNLSIFNSPIITIENNFLNMRPFGYDQSCSPVSNLTKSARAFGIISFVVKISEQIDNSKSVSFFHRVTWLDLAKAPEICPIGQSPLNTLCNFGGDFSSGNSSYVVITAQEDQALVTWSLEMHETEGPDWIFQDEDWLYGETINDYSWAFLSVTNQRVLTYETSVYKLEIITGALNIEDYIRFSVKSNMYTTTATQTTPTTDVKLEVLDSQGLKSVHLLKVQVVEVNDDPVWFGTTLDHIKPTEEDLFGPIDLNSLANDQFDPSPQLTFRMVGINQTGLSNPCNQTGTTNSDLGIFPVYTKFTATIDPSGNFDFVGKLNQNHFEQNHSVPTFDIVTFEVSDVSGGCIFKEIKVELQELDDTPVIVKPNPSLAHAYVLSEGGSAITTEIDANDAIDFNMDWDSTRHSPGALDGYLTFTVNRLDGPTASSNYLVNPDHNTNPKNLVISLKNPDIYSPTVENWELILNQSSSSRYSFGRAISGVTTKISFLISMTEVNDSPILNIVGNSLCIPGATTGQTACTISSFEDTPMSATLMSSLGYVVSDEESGIGASLINHVFSFSKTSVVTQITKVASSAINNNQTIFYLLNHDSVNLNAQLKVDLVAPCVDTQFCDNHGAFAQDIYVLEVISGVVQSFAQETSSRFTYIMQSVNDSPYFTNTSEFPSIIKQSDGVSNQQHPAIDISSWKVDVDANSSDVCFSLPLLSTSKFTASLESNNIECFNGVCIAPCLNEKLIIRPNLGSLGQATLELRLDDGQAGQASHLFNFQIVDTKPKFIIGGLSENKLTFTSDTAISLALTSIIIDDDILNALLVANADDFYVSPPTSGAFWIEYPDNEVDNLVAFSISNLLKTLIVTPKYDNFTNGFKDGQQRIRILYKDKRVIDPVTSVSVQNLTSSMFTVNVKHGFIEWAKFDDTNGDGAKGAGDRVLIKFSDTSGGVRGLTTSTQIPTIISPIDKNNINKLVQAKLSISNVSFAFGNPVVDISYFDSNFVSIKDPLINPFTYLQITYGLGVKNFDKVLIPNNIVPSSKTLPVYFNSLSQKALISETVAYVNADTIAPRMVFAYLIDMQGDNLTQFGQDDQIQVHFSEFIRLPVGEFTVNNLFSFENVNIGSNSTFEIVENRILITLGVGANINTNGTLDSELPRIIANQERILDKSSVTPLQLSTFGVRQLLLRDDKIGPSIIEVRYNSSTSNSDYTVGDQLYIKFSEQIDTSKFIISGNIDNMFILPTPVNLQTPISFGVALLEWRENNTLLIVTFGAASNLPTQGQLAGLNLKASSLVLDKKGNAAGVGDIIPSLGVPFPTSDTISPDVKFTFEKNGLILDSEGLNHIGKGSLLIKAKFDLQQQTAQPVIQISGAGAQLVTAMMSGVGLDFSYIHPIQVDNGIDLRDSLRTVSIIVGEQDPHGNNVVVSGLHSFITDTVDPEITLAQVGTVQIINGITKQVVEADTVTIQASSNEKLVVAQVLPIFPTNLGIVTTMSQDQFDFQITLSKLSPGDNSFTVKAIDPARNQVEIRGEIYRVGGDTTGGGTPINAQDLDNDGVINHEDAFPTNGLEQYDTDGDGIGDNEDLDDDGDGIEDALDKITLINGEVVDLSKDSDNDGIPNIFDIDMDGDGILNTQELSFIDVYHIVGGVLDTDNDGIPNYTDPDDDNDGLTDLQELSLVPRSKTWEKDSDGDGDLDGVESTIGTRYYAPNTQNYNTWVDAFDFDNDGIINLFDKFPFDSDNDGQTNDIDNDSDGDGIPNNVDSFPNDQDNDGIEDKDDEDKDNNLIPDQLESVVTVTRNDCDLINPASAKSCIAIPKIGGKIAFRVPETGLAQDVTYDMSGLSDEYDGLKNIILAQDQDIIDIVPIIEIRLDQDMTVDTSKYEILGKVLHINGKIRPNSEVRFPFALPSFLIHDNTLKSSDLVLEFYDENQKKWIQDGTSYQISGGVLYANIKHFSSWRVLRDISNIFQNTGGSFASIDGGGGGGGGCFIVTAASGSIDSNSVQFFSYFRDSFLLKFDLGKKLMSLYYRYSPPIAKSISGSNFMKFVVNIILIPIAIFALLLMFWPLTLLLMGLILGYKKQNKRI
ncbi:MAG: hypothetical protein COB02_06330 [Candidatus Cloacimonadota bacterium]|nr:MAG: hypothetical protein COB02_06330 [Candidatus Cloacimonadota bacterium]